MPLWFFKSQKYIFKNRFKLLKNAMDKKDNNLIVYRCSIVIIQLIKNRSWLHAKTERKTTANFVFR